MASFFIDRVCCRCAPLGSVAHLRLYTGEDAVAASPERAGRFDNGNAGGCAVYIRVLRNFVSLFEQGNVVSRVVGLRWIFLFFLFCCRYSGVGILFGCVDYQGF